MDFFNLFTPDGVMLVSVSFKPSGLFPPAPQK